MGLSQFVCWQCITGGCWDKARWENSRNESKEAKKISREIWNMKATLKTSNWIPQFNFDNSSTGAYRLVQLWRNEHLALLFLGYDQWLKSKRNQLVTVSLNCVTFTVSLIGITCYLNLCISQCKTRDSESAQCVHLFVLNDWGTSSCCNIRKGRCRCHTYGQKQVFSQLKVDCYTFVPLGSIENNTACTVELLTGEVDNIDNFMTHYSVVLCWKTLVLDINMHNTCTRTTYLNSDGDQANAPWQWHYQQ